MPQCPIASDITAKCITPWAAECNDHEPQLTQDWCMLGHCWQVRPIPAPGSLTLFMMQRGSHCSACDTCYDVCDYLGLFASIRSSGIIADRQMNRVVLAMLQQGLYGSTALVIWCMPPATFCKASVDGLCSVSLTYFCVSLSNLKPGREAASNGEIMFRKSFQLELVQLS